jgi:hypothetical protein
MDQKSTQPEMPQSADEVWRRFTLLDLLILFSGHGAALGIMKWYGAFDDLGVLFVEEKLILLGIIFILGGILSLPGILLVQYGPRHRRAKISVGEIHALINLLYWLSVLLSNFFHAFYISQSTFLGISVPMFLFFCYGGVKFFHNCCSSKDTAPCYWLSQYGYLLSLVSVLFMLFELLVPADLPLSKRW